MFKNSFDPDKAFFSLSIVKKTFIFVFSAAFISSLFIVVFSDLKPDVSYKGFNHFLVVFKFPIGLLATLIPIVALYAANHRSVQTRRQIEISKDQNNFSNYYKHLEEFDKYSKNSMYFGYEVSHVNKLHKNLFSSMRNGDPSIDKDALENVDKIIKSTSSILNDLSEGLEAELQKDLIRRILVYRNELREFLNVKVKNNKFLKTSMLCELQVHSTRENSSGIFYEIRDLIDIYIDFCGFDVNYEPSEVLMDYKNINLYSIPQVGEGPSSYFPAFELTSINL